MNQRDYISQEEVRKSILKFFLDSPDCVESFVGIARWRLLEEEVHRSVKRTEEALKWLVEKAFLVPSTAGSRAIYKLNLEKREEAKEFLRVGELEGGGSAAD